MNAESILVAIVAALLSGLLGVIISNWYYRKQQAKNMKIDLLKKVMGFTFQLTPIYNGDTNEIISSLNQIAIIFNDSKQVMDFLKQYKNSKSVDDLSLLIKGMCSDLKIKYIEYGFNDGFFHSPFTFNEGCRKQDV